MRKHPTVFSNPCALGVTLTEYSVLIALVGLVSVVGLNALGGAASTMFQNTTQALGDQNSTLSLLAPTAQAATANGVNNNGQAGQIVANGSSQPGAAGPHYKIATDPVTGQPTLQLINSGSGSGTNVSSSDGMVNIVGSMMVADKLEAMAEAATDPASQNYYEQLATWTYYLGATEGVIDNVNGLTIDQTFQGNRTYTQENALTDMQNYQSYISDLIAHPPAGISPSTVEMVKPLADSSISIADAYLADNGEATDPQGNAIGKGHQKDASTPGKPNGSNGLALGKDKPKKEKPVNASYDQIVPPGQMRAAAQQILHDNVVDSAPVETTLDNAATVDPLANTTTTP